ncbi:two component transcriptional regulator, LuxR family [Dyadobacter soli]|uniref:Two component transcriptional regulator, LuxR family n=1 Tax=Dyadobacter soli TaxID=659014 RepID=A0A1G7FV87_9BACT|nr:response regulator transcription factor [Dyadobacter soli]SDE79796.1 two component transcriptional regulator, LuxR family [Dyadobacter soli]
MTNRIVIFDDNEERLKSVEMLLNLSPDFECAGTFKNCNKLLEDIARCAPHLILMDIDMPGMNGIEATRLIRKNLDLLPVIIQTIFEENEKIFDSLRAGANGYLLKKTPPEKFLESLREALDGGAPMTGSIASKVLLYFSAEQQATKEYHLTEREKLILGLLVKGYSYKMIANECKIAFNTVNNHIRNIYDKLYVNSATEAVSLAIKERLV